MAYTQQIPVNNSAGTAIQCKTACRNVRITENRGVGGWPTSDFLIYKPDTTVTPVRIAAGAQYTFMVTWPPAVFSVGQTIGYVQTVSGSTTFDQDEDSL